MNEKDNNNHDILLKQLYVNKNVDYNSTGYICQLFRIFNNMKKFCITEKKIDSCILCHKTYETIIKPYHHFFEINEDLLNEKSILNAFINKYKENYNYECVCETMKDNFLTTKTIYNIISYPNFLFIFFDLEYKKLLINKDKIIMMSEKNFVLGYDISYTLISLVVIPFDGHFSCVILKPYGKYIKNKFKSCKNYLHDNLKSNGNIIEFDDSEDLFKFGIPHNFSNFCMF